MRRLARSRKSGAEAARCGRRARTRSRRLVPPPFRRRRRLVGAAAGSEPSMGVAKRDQPFIGQRLAAISDLDLGPCDGLELGTGWAAHRRGPRRTRRRGGLRRTRAEPEPAGEVAPPSRTSFGETGPCGERRHATAAIDPTTTASRMAMPMNSPTGGPPCVRVTGKLGPRSTSLGSGRSGMSDGTAPDPVGEPLAGGAPDGSARLRALVDRAAGRVGSRPSHSPGSADPGVGVLRPDRASGADEIGLPGRNPGRTARDAELGAGTRSSSKRST